MSAIDEKPELYDVFLIGVHTDPGITSHLRTYSLKYVSKALTSSYKNWASINRMLADHEPHKRLVVITKVTEYNLIQSLLPNYDAQFNEMCELIPKFSNIGYLYDGALAGDFTCFKENAWKQGWEEEHQRTLASQLPPHLAEQYLKDRQAEARDIDRWCKKFKIAHDKEHIKELLKARIATLQLAGVRLVPYRGWKDIRLSVIQFLTESKRGLILRIFLANERFLAGEFEKLLKLFVDYLRKVESFQISIDQVRTDRGQIIEFYSKDGHIGTDDLSGLLEKFSHFLQVCSIDMEQAINLIGPTAIPKDKLNYIITRYAKEARRLLLDVQQEKERKILSLRHRLQAEVVDYETEAGECGIEAAGQDVSPIVKAGALDLIGLAGFSAGGMTVLQNPTITMNNPQFIAKANGIIAQELNGDIQYSEDDVQILQFLKTNSTSMEYLELKSSLDQLKDESTPEPQKTTAWQKLRGFLSKHSDKLGDLGIKIGERIIDKYVFGQP